MKQIPLLALIITGMSLISTGLQAAGMENIDQTTPGASSDGIEQLFAEKCSGCHGNAGKGLKPTVPKLAGQHADYLYKQLRNFMAADGKPAGPDNPVYPTPSDLVYVAAPEGKLPQRTNPIYFLAMNGMVKGLSDNEMKALAVYLEAQKRQPETSQLDDEELAAAQKLYRAGDSARGLPPCAGCHGPNGAGVPAQFPRLSGQYATYTENQLKNFREGYRTNDPNGMMRDVTYKLTEKEITVLANYIAGLR